MRKRMVIPIVAVLFIVMVFSTINTQLLFGQKKTGCKGNHKMVTTVRCEYFDTGAVKSCECTAGEYNILECQCCP